MMKVLRLAHLYELSSVEEGDPQQIQFIEREKRKNGEIVTIRNGTTEEEVIAMLINRLNGLGAICSYRQDNLAVTKLEEALMWLNNRTGDRVSRGVENTSRE